MLATSMLLGGCGRNPTQQSDNKSVTIEKQPNNKSVTDTMLVVGVLDQPAQTFYEIDAMKHLYCVDKQGNKKNFSVDVEIDKAKGDAMYVQRGDTIVIEHDGKDIKELKNLTMERMVKRYVNGR